MRPPERWRGRPCYHEAFGREFREDLDAHPDIVASFDALMGPAGRGVPDYVVLGDPADWESVKSVVDGGGGTGALLAEILRTRPEVRGTLIDLPRTVARSGEIFRAASVADLYLLKSVLSDWPDREATAIVRRCAEAARPSGRVAVFTGAGPGEDPSPALLMMVLVGGRDRTLDELRELAREAGLEVSAVGRQPSGRVVVKCRPT